MLLKKKKKWKKHLTFNIQRVEKQKNGLLIEAIQLAAQKKIFNKYGSWRATFSSKKNRLLAKFSSFFYLKNEKKMVKSWYDRLHTIHSMIHLMVLVDFWKWDQTTVIANWNVEMPCAKQKKSWTVFN